MSCFRVACRYAAFFFLCLALSGCLPPGDSQSEEQKEPHFLMGKNLVSQMDYQGAVGSFERTLEINPRNASAHYELGWLYEEKVVDPAAAIYHYNQYLRLRQGRADNPDLIAQRIISCKMELAKTVSAVGPLSASTQRDLERVLLENKVLTEQVNQLGARLASRPAPSPANPANPPGNRPGVRNPPPANPHGGPVAPGRTNPPAAGRPASGPVSRTPISPAPPPGRAHTVQAHETPTAIAHKYGITVSALMAANPDIRPNRLHPGQVLRIP